MYIFCTFHGVLQLQRMQLRISERNVPVNYFRLSNEFFLCNELRKEFTMAKLDIYGTSPNCSLFNDWPLTTEPFCNSEFGIVDPDPIELFEDLNDWPPSIFSDIKKIQSDASATSGSISGCDDVPYVDLFEPELKPEIRNIDCMWSAQPTSSSTASSAGSVGTGGTATNKISSVLGKTNANIGAVTTAVPLAAVIENAQNISNNKQQQQQIKVETVKEETIDNDYEQQLLQHSIPKNKVQQQQQQITTISDCMQQIKPGMSLLRKSNIQQQHTQRKQQQQQQQLIKQIGCSIKIPSKTTAEFLRERDQTSAVPSSAAAAATATNKLSSTSISSAIFGRPDTPLSLDDDPSAPEFKHNVDLRACVMGSNNISLVPNDPSNIINHLSEQLQDTSKNRIDLHSLVPDTVNDFADVLDFIVKDDRILSSTALLNPGGSSNSNSNSDNKNNNKNNKSKPSGATTIQTLYNRQCNLESDEDDDDIGDYDDYVEDEEEEEEYNDFGSICGSTASASTSSLLNRSLASTGGLSSNSSQSSAYVSATSSLSSVCSGIGNGGGGGGGGDSGGQTYPAMILHSDHSYTRCNDDIGTNLETPSDSDEEIDVVSIGDKKLPTNPSDRDRRALQHKVAHKFSNARIVKTPNGVRTIPPRRRITVELPYTPVSNSPVKSLTNSRYPSPSTTPYHNQYTSKYVQQQTQRMISVINSGRNSCDRNGGSGGGGISNARNIEKQRKRIATLAPPPMTGITNGSSPAGAAAITGNHRGGGVGGGGGSSINLIDYLPPGKKHRNSKKQHHHQQQQQRQHNTHHYASPHHHTYTMAATAAGGGGGVMVDGNGLVKRHYSLDENTDTMEKRNLHNDMERQRRIGLKNLFESLKKQIPSIRDKERAPKVNILREAAKLCEALTREDQQLQEQKALLKDQLRKKQEILARLRMSVQED